MMPNKIFSLFLLPLVSNIALADVPYFIPAGDLVLQITDAWKFLNEYNDKLPFEISQAVLFAKLDNINIKLSEISETLGIDNANSKVERLVKELINENKNLKPLNRIGVYRKFVDTYYNKMQKYVMNFEDYENETMLYFAKRVVSNYRNSVGSLIEEIYHVFPDNLQVISTELKRTNVNIFCSSNQAPQQIILNLMYQLLQTMEKGYLTTQFGYIMKTLCNKGNFTQEALDATEEFKRRINGVIAQSKNYVSNSSRQFWRCDPQKHIPDKTYISITNLIQGYIVQENQLDKDSTCFYKCEHYSQTTTPIKCNDEWCRSTVPVCNKILDCTTIDSNELKICLDRSLARRYKYVEESAGKINGQRQGCSKNDLFFISSWTYKVFWKCSYCFCLCDEGPKFYSDRFINLRSTTTDYKNNKVVTGIRFVKHNRIIHLQLQEGKLLPYGRIDANSVRWIPVENYTTLDPNIIAEQDYHTLTFEDRGIELQTITAKTGYLVTGLRFRKLAQRIDLEVLTTPFNFTNGDLKHELSMYQDDSNLLRYKFGKEIQLQKEIDIPTRSTGKSIPYTHGHFIKFTNTGYHKDLGQTTVPFFDAQPVSSMVPVPLSGVGIFYKTFKDYGGFITPKIVTYDYSSNLTPLFKENKDH